jgi:hypothetical protein
MQAAIGAWFHAASIASGSPTSHDTTHEISWQSGRIGDPTSIAYLTCREHLRKDGTEEFSRRPGRGRDPR